LLALGIYLWQLSVPEQISFYDTGVYLAATIHLVSGVLPYQRFTFVQPPGLLYILSPIGLVSRLVGSHDGEIFGRVLTSLFTATNCSLVAWLVRHRGRTAMAVAGVGLAVTPVAFFDSSGIKLEPYCVTFILIAALVLVAQGRVSLITPRAASVAGALLGVAALVKLWAFFPFVALVIILFFRARHRLWRFVVGAGTTFVVGVAPFLIVAPRRFISEVLIDQLGRRVTPSDSANWIERLRTMTGFVPTSIAPSDVVTIIAFTILGVVVVFAFYRPRNVTDTDLLIVAVAVLSLVMLFVGPEFYTYYAYFTSPFLIALAVVSVSLVAQPLLAHVRNIQLTGPTRRLMRWATGASGLILVAGMVLYVTTFLTNYAWFYGYYGPWIAVISRVVPENSCVLYNEVSFGIYSNRFITSDSKCPNVVDVYGQWLANGYQLVAPNRTFTHQWQSYFSRAQYVVFNAPRPSDVPWDHELVTWFSHHFQRIYDRYYIVVYRADVKA